MRSHVVLISEDGDLLNAHFEVRSLTIFKTQLGVGPGVVIDRKPIG